MTTSVGPTRGARVDPRCRTGELEASLSGVVQGEDRQFTLTRLRGWLDVVDSPARTSPPRWTRAELAGLGGAELAAHNDARAVWHANLGPIRTPQLLDLHEDLAEIVEANRQDGDKNKPAALVDAYPGLGKTTAVLDYAKSYHRRQVQLRGPSTPGGSRSPTSR
jgi:hypothetical protein